MYKYIIFIAIFFISCGHPDYRYPHVIIDTGLGEIELELYQEKAPKTVAAFLSNTDAGLYTSGSFYRVLKSEEFPTDFNTGLIQGGTWKISDQQHVSLPGITHESTKQSGLSHTDGIVSMARQDTGTATTEFFICIGDQSFFDFARNGNPDGQGFAAFGKVFKGMDIVRKIQSQNSLGDKFEKRIEIISIKKL